MPGVCAAVCDGAATGGAGGPFWHRDSELDLVCRNADGSHTCGECKWTRRPVGERELQELQQKAQSFPPEWQQGLRYVLFSRSGFSDALRRHEDGERVVLVGLEDLYGLEARA